MSRLHKKAPHLARLDGKRNIPLFETALVPHLRKSYLLSATRRGSSHVHVGCLGISFKYVFETASSVLIAFRPPAFCPNFRSKVLNV